MPRTQTIKDLVIENLRVDKDLIVDGKVYADIENTAYGLASNTAEKNIEGAGLTDFNFNDARRARLVELDAITEFNSGKIIKDDERTKLTSIKNVGSGIADYPTTLPEDTTPAKAAETRGEGFIITEAERAKLYTIQYDLGGETFAEMITPTERAKLGRLKFPAPGVDGYTITDTNVNKLEGITNVGSGMIIKTDEREKLTNIKFSNPDDPDDITEEHTLISNTERLRLANIRVSPEDNNHDPPYYIISQAERDKIATIPNYSTGNGIPDGQLIKEEFLQKATTGKAKGILSVIGNPQKNAGEYALNVDNGVLSLNANRVVTFTDSTNRTIDPPVTFQETGTSNPLLTLADDKVGIGTDDPQTYKLKVEGTANITGALTVDGNINGNANTATKIASITNANIVQLTTEQILTNKTLTSPTITGNGSIAGIFKGNINGNANTATKIASITNANIVQLTTEQILTNKTLTSPTITGSIAGTFSGNGSGLTNINANTVINGVYTTGNQEIGGSKSFTNGITVRGQTTIGSHPKIPANIKEQLNIDGGTILTRNVAYAGNQNAPYLIAGTYGYSTSATLNNNYGANWGQYGFQHRIESDSDGRPVITIWAGEGKGKLYHLDMNGNLWISGKGWVTSDERIKTEISDFSDSYALELVRNIPSREYHYKELDRREEYKTIGFIAQEVRKILPNAVKLNEDFISDEMRTVNNNNLIWENFQDKYLLTITDYDVPNNTNVKFNVSNDFDPEKDYLKNLDTRTMETLELVKRDDGKFLFDNKWKYVFIYGKKVDDYHTIDKSKIFALHHPAIQELDRQQQADKREIAALKQQNETLQQQLANVMERLTALENK